MELASQLIDESRAGKVPAVQSILSNSLVAQMPVKVKADFLSLGLFEAAAEGHLAIVRLLVDAGAALDHPHAASGDTALTIAAFAGRNNVVRLLVSAGANVNARNNEGISALMVAAGRCSREVVIDLLQSGADIRARAPGGLTARTFAEMEGRRDILDLLRKKSKT